MTKWLVAQPVGVQNGRIEYTIPERPLLHACCAESNFGDFKVDIRPEVHPDLVADITKPIPVPDNSYAACFADFPWTAPWKKEVSAAMKELLRIAPIVYTISPWTYGASWVTASFKVCYFPGVNQALLFGRYERVPNEFRRMLSPNAD